MADKNSIERLAKADDHESVREIKVEQFDWLLLSNKFNIWCQCSPMYCTTTCSYIVTSSRLILVLQKAPENLTCIFNPV